MANSAHIDAIGLVASDLAATLRFYRAAGCDVPDPDAADLDDHIECDLGGVRLMFDTEEVMQSFTDETWPAGGGRLTLAAQCASPADVDRLHGELAGIGRGSQVSPFDAPWGQRYATVLDPDGIRLDLYAPLTSG
jgi:uncharacterized glyoxalase superfamily protein PhnB